MSGSSLKASMSIARPSAGDRSSAKLLANRKRIRTLESEAARPSRKYPQRTCGKIVKLQKLNRRNCFTVGKKFQTQPENLIMNAVKILRESAVATPENSVP